MENTFTVAKPFLIYSKVVGYFPMSFDGPTRKGFLRTKWTDVVSSLFMILLLAIFFVYNLLSDVSVNKSSVLSYGWRLSITVEYFSFLYLIFYQIAKRKNVKKLLEKIQQTDEEVRLLSSSRWTFFISIPLRLRLFTFSWTTQFSKPLFVDL